MRKWILALIVSLSLLFPVQFAAAADAPTLTVMLPALTNKAQLTVPGRTVPGSTIKAGTATAKADDTGEFAITLSLTEGNNNISLQAATPSGQQLTWTGSVTLDTTPPALTTRIPTVTNDNFFPLTGRVEIGAKITVNGAPVTVDNGGTFRVELHPDLQPKVDIVVTDAAGNQNSIHRTITYTDKVPWMQIDPFMGIASQAAPGTVVDNPENPKWTPAKADATGLVRNLTDLSLGENEFWLRFTPPTGEAYYEYYWIWVPVTVDMPRRVNTETLEVPGRILKGYSLLVNGNPVQVDSEGKFTFRLNLALGDNKVHFDIASPGGNKTGYDAAVRRSDPDFSRIHDGVWPLQFVGWSEGTLFISPDVKTPLVIGPSGDGALQLPVKPGLNQWRILVIRTTGTAQIFRYTYMGPRVVKMQVGKTQGTVNGEAKEAPVAPQLLESTTYVPLRFLAESLGAKVEWNQETKTATFTLDGKIVSVTLDSADAQVNGETKTMPAPARLVDGSTLVPLRFISENLGFKVEWDASIKGITVTAQ